MRVAEVVMNSSRGYRLSKTVWKRGVWYANRRIQCKCYCYNSARMNFPSCVRVFFIVRTVWGWSQEKLSAVSSQLSAKKKSLTVWFFA